ncbi:malate synthase A [Micractinium conductrix]|uniref:Malate synthase n=1 Tax=Micractinium conductrix TaxID=554055 RepID=A0A2P6VL94_9CHLO|nr:malate synthase A [Micractinium conductrix]|eukprot:PSC74854.1 malate synthase A [Micractinium conductrix]
MVPRQAEVGGVAIHAPLPQEYKRILTPEALSFVGHLARCYTPRVEQLLAARREVQARYDAGGQPDWLPETKHVREGNWKVAPLPADLQDRRVEITGPTDRKMVINALNSGANVYMPDFEDSNSPTWSNLIEGQINLYDAVRRTITLSAPGGKTYRLKDKVAVMLVRPRGWHLWEKHISVGGHPVPGSIFDFALYFFHNAKELLNRGSGPYFYLPKMQSHLECRLWNDVFVESQRLLGIPNGTIKATCLIETLPAAFEMDEFLYELRDHSAGLNCGRWDYMFSFIKTLRNDPTRIFPDRGLVGMDQPFLRAYTQLVIKTCHKRGVHAIGGMSALIPVKGDEAKNQAAFERVRVDKLREVQDGHDGTWVAHPGLIPIAKQIFDQHMREPNQIASKPRADVRVTKEELLKVPTGPRTVAALRNNINVSIQYLEAWLNGNGCVPLHNLMEDAATAEISRSSVWQWLRYGVTLDNGQRLTADAVNTTIQAELDGLRKQVGEARFATGRFLEAAFLFKLMVNSTELADFLTLGAYDILVATEYGPTYGAPQPGGAVGMRSRM